MRLRQAVAGVGKAEIAILGVGAQAVGFEILVAVMADGDALLRPRLRLAGADVRPRLLIVFSRRLIWRRSSAVFAPAISSARRRWPRP